MATDDVNIPEDSEMAECDEDKVVTMMDVLQEQQDFEEDANAVLGASDDKNCTYAKGYIKRQALYACLTCCPDAKTDSTRRAGVCLACSLNCHENHELVELYTKRNFRCDCGNPKFNSHPCQFTSSKSDLNDDNIYNQNFSGLYCVCHRPYPDTEATFEDDMIQCIICEDWLHSSHIETTVPANDQYSEMICKACMEKNDFLHDYSNLTVNVELGDVDILTVNGDKYTDTVCNGDADKKALANGEVDSNTEFEPVTQNGDTEIDEDKENSVHQTVVDESKEAAEQNEVKPDKESVTANKMDLDAENENKQESQSTDAKETSEGSIEEKKVSDTPVSEQTSGSDDKDSDIQEQKDEQTKTDGDKANQTTDEASKPTGKEATEVSKAEDNLVKTSKYDDTEEATVKATTNKNSESTEITPVPDNIDEKPDAVMDAIDALLKEPADTDTDSKDNKQNSDEVPKNEQNTDNDKKQDDIAPEKHEGTDTEMTESDSGKPNDIELSQSASENKDIEKSTLTDTKDNTSKDGTSNTVDENKVSENKRKLSEEAEEISPKKAKVSLCIRPKSIKKVHKGATFWPSNFRQKLCTCGECISMYKDLHVLFLTDPEDTVSAYESLGKENVDGGASQYEKGLQALSSLDRIQQINALTEYNKMRDKLLDFLKSFKDRKLIVREEDIKAFFAGMKPKREPDGVYFCR